MPRNSDVAFLGRFCGGGAIETFERCLRISNNLYNIVTTLFFNTIYREAKEFPPRIIL
jgi:hypothetical protein